MTDRPTRRIRPVFITGAPRCGSSWVGEILGSCAHSRYVYEPLNHRWVPTLRGHLPHFTYFASQSNVSPMVRQQADKAFNGWQSFRQLARAARRGYLRSATKRPGAVVIKDPTAVLTSAWVAQQYDAQIVFVMRHPCGFASSLNNLSWKLNVHSLLRQEKLMRDHLGPFTDVLHHARNDKWLTRGVIWAAIHTVFAKQNKLHPEWHLYRYEDICSDPSKQFLTMTQSLGLKPGHRTHQKMTALSTGYSPDTGSTRRNSRLMPEIWRERMTPAEIDAVMGVVNEFGLTYY